MFTGSHEDRQFALPSRNTTQLAQAVPEFSRSGTVAREKLAYRKRPAAYFAAKQRSAVILSLFHSEHRGGGSSVG